MLAQIVKPQTFMNLSGEAASKILSFYKPSLEDFIAVYDDVDLDFGTIRTREGGGSGGHNGVKNLIQQLDENKSPVAAFIAESLPGVGGQIVIPDNYFPDCTAIFYIPA